MSQRSKARKALADRMASVVEAAPMLFISDPEIQILAGELLIRDLLALGWTPPPEDDE